MNIRYLSLFSGIEAATVAWEPLGWTPVAFAQYEPGDNIQFPSKVLQYHYPDVPNLGDVTKITEEQIKALGNSMAVPVMRWIGERIEWSLSHPIKEDKSDKIPWQPELF